MARQTCPNQRVLNQQGFSGTITLENLTITGGTTTGNGAGLLSLSDVIGTDLIVTGNTAQQGGGAIRTFDLTLTRSTITDNTSVTLPGGAVFAEGLVEVTDSTVSGNSSGDDGGAIRTNGDVVITRSTASGNGAAGSGGGISAGNEVFVENSTITGNTAGASGGGIEATSVELVYATVVGNTAPAAANVDAGQLETFGTVLALAQGGGSSCSVGGTSERGQPAARAPRRQRWADPDPDARAREPAHRRDPGHELPGRRCVRRHDRPARRATARRCRLRHRGGRRRGRATGATGPAGTDRRGGALHGVVVRPRGFSPPVGLRYPCPPCAASTRHGVRVPPSEIRTPTRLI